MNRYTKRRTLENGYRGGLTMMSRTTIAIDVLRRVVSELMANKFHNDSRHV
jgi:hypothetical protein